MRYFIDFIWRIPVLFICFFSGSLMAQERINGCSRTTSVTIGSVVEADYEHDGWTLVFEDDFSDNSLNSEKWFTCFNGWGHAASGDSMAYYLDQNIVLQNGIVSLVAKREPGYYNVWYFHDDTSELVPRYFDYTSGWIETKTKFKYGLFEERCKIPEGQGLWPAFWLWGGWSYKNEIDVYEIKGESPNKVNTNLHIWTPGNLDISCTKEYSNNTSFANNYHVFSVEWDEFKLIYRIDGNIIRTFYCYRTLFSNITNVNELEPNHTYTESDIFPTRAQSVILNLGISGGHFGDPPNYTTPFPSSMDIDYVRVYKRCNGNRNITLSHFSDRESDGLTAKDISIGETTNLGQNKCIVLSATREILLNNGFEIPAGDYLDAKISTTGYPLRMIEEDDVEEIEETGDVYGRYNNDDVVDTNQSVVIYPNPNSGIFNIQLTYPLTEYNRITILDSYGSVVYSISAPEKTSYSVNLPCSTGYYTMVIEMINQTTIRKIIIK